LTFDKIIRRQGTASLKWEAYGADVLPLWVADMDFASPPAVIEAVRARADHGVFGYSVVPESLVAAILEYLERRYGWTVLPEWLVWLPSLVSGITLACGAAGDRGDEVMTITPAYPPFLRAPSRAERGLLAVPAVLRGDRWRLPLDAMEASVTPRTRVLLLCHPHNPLGRAWEPAELSAVAGFCRRHSLVLCSDEIHCDLVLDGAGHMPAALVEAVDADALITLMSPSKTYNLPGLNFAFALVRDPDLRRRFRDGGRGLLPEPGCFAVSAAEAAYRDTADWLTGLLDYLRGNRDLVEAFVADSLPSVAMTHVEATYLAWLDVSRLRLADPMQACLDAGVALSPGSAFGDPDYLRLNFACPRAVLRDGLCRLRSALA
jgi:cysteine-S-conjugate beta-lyase